MGRLLGITVLTAVLAAPASANLDFHLRLLERGKVSYASGEYQKAVRELRLAAFGFLDSLPHYEMAQVYLTLSHRALGDQHEASRAISNLLRAEQIHPTYRILQLDPAVKRSFEQAFAQLAPTGTLSESRTETEPLQSPRRETQPKTPAQPRVTESAPPQSVESPPEVSEAAPSPRTEAPPADPPTESKAPVRAVEQPSAAAPSVSPGRLTEIQELEELLRKQPDSVPVLLALAEATLREGRSDQAAFYALRALEQEPVNPMAHVYLGRIAARELRWQPAVDHLTTAEARLPLSDQDQALLFVARVQVGHDAAAWQMETELTASARSRRDVAAALKMLRARDSAPQPAAPTAPPPPLQQEARTEPIPPPPSATTLPPADVPMSAEEIFGLVREARDLTSAEECLRARRIYDRLLAEPSLERYVLLAVARGLNRCRYHGSSMRAYDRAMPLSKGEGRDLFLVAVNHYETGNVAQAKEYLRRALEVIEPTPEVVHYRSLIESAR